MLFRSCLLVPGVGCPLLHCLPSWFLEKHFTRGRTGGFSKRAGAVPTWAKPQAPKGSVVSCGSCWTCDWRCVLHLTYLFLRHLGPGLGPQAHPRFRGPHSELAVTGQVQVRCALGQAPGVGVCSSLQVDSSSLWPSYLPLGRRPPDLCGDTVDRKSVV